MGHPTEKRRTVGFAEVHLLGTAHWHPAEALRVLRWLSRLRPQTLLVELPEGCETVVAEGFEKLFAPESGFAIQLADCEAGAHDAAVLSVTDSITQTCRWAIANQVPWHCIDLQLEPGVQDAAPRKPPLSVPDPWWVLDESRSYGKTLARCLAQVPATESDLRREEHMAAVIRRRCTALRGRVAVIVGAAHIARLSAWLAADASPRPQQHAEIAGEPVLARVPAAALVSSFLGPLPALASMLGKIQAKPAEVETFSATQAIEMIVGLAEGDYRGALGHPLQVSQVERFWRAISKRVTSAGRRHPSAIDLCEVAGGVDDQLQDFLARRCYGQPVSSESSDDGIPTVDFGSGDSQPRAVPAWVRGMHADPGSIAEHQRWVESSRRAAKLLPPIRRASASGPLSYRVLTDSSWLAGLAMTHQLVRQTRQQPRQRTVEWKGGKVGELDLRAMVRSAARGKRAVLCKRAETAGFSLDLDGAEKRRFSPKVWIFEDSPGVAYEETVCFSYFNKSFQYYTMPALITPYTTEEAWDLAALAVLAPWHFLRFDKAHYGQLPHWVRSHGVELPRRNPWTTSESLKPSWDRPYEHLIWLAIRHARDCVYVISDTGNRVTGKLAAIAASRRVRLEEVSLKRFPAAEVARFRCFRFEPQIVEDLF